MTAATDVLFDRLAPPTAAGGRAERGRTWLSRHGLPTTREEAWRYTPVDDVVRALQAAIPATNASEAVSRAVVDELAGVHGGIRLVFVNGAMAGRLCDAEPVPAGLWVGNADGLRRRPRPASGRDEQPVDGFHALNWAVGRDVAAVLVDPDVQLDRPVHVVHLSVPGDVLTASHPRTVVRVGADSRLQVIETFVGLPGSSITNASTRIVTGEPAAVTYHRIQAETPGGIHVGRTGIEQAARSAVEATSIMTGAQIARSAIDVRLSGPDARVDVDGLYLPAGHQRHDTVITVDHLAPRCTSTQRFKGIVDDHGRGSFSGHVIVRPGASGTDARQSNRNLVLCPTAQADTRPWLEIFADDVRCTHGATVGRLDDDALFYLRSRGIPIAHARAMLVAAFAAEIIDDITPASLRDLVAAAPGGGTTRGVPR
jgi:Fe-S cluster assembly protein SufD